MNNQIIKSAVIALLLFPTTIGVSAPKKMSAGASSSVVYICTGGKAYAYHKSKSCSGLNKCSGDIVGVQLSKAKSMGRRACKKCY